MALPWLMVQQPGPIYWLAVFVLLLIVLAAAILIIERRRPMLAPSSPPLVAAKVVALLVAGAAVLTLMRVLDLYGTPLAFSLWRPDQLSGYVAATALLLAIILVLETLPHLRRLLGSNIIWQASLAGIKIVALLSATASMALGIQAAGTRVVAFVESAGVGRGPLLSTLLQPNYFFFMLATGLVGLVILFELLEAAYSTIERIRRTWAVLAVLKPLAIASTLLTLLFLPDYLAPLRNITLLSISFCGILTFYRELHRRFRPGQPNGDRSASSLLGGFRVAVEFISFMLLAGGGAATALTGLLGVVQAIHSISLLLRAQDLSEVRLFGGLAVAWTENFAALMWVIALYYALFYTVRRLLGSQSFSWMDPPNWRTAMPHLKYNKTLRFKRGFPLFVELAESDLNNIVRAAYIRGIVGPGADGSELDTAATISPIAAAGQPFTFAIIGDPGEGDHSQLKITQGGQIGLLDKKLLVFQKIQKILSVAALRSKSANGDTPPPETQSFVIISSDIVYPAGELMDYERTVYRPYGGTDTPIYAIPGNHDWYNSLQGFLLNFTYLAAHRRRGRWAAALRKGPWAAPPLGRQRWREVEWLRKKYDLHVLGGRPEEPGTYQRLPFFEMVFPGVPLTVLAVDTGCTGSIDRLQRAWLERRLADGRARGNVLFVLLSEPIYVNGAFAGAHKPGLAEIYALLREYKVDVVCAGDTHAYQRYQVTYTHRDGTPQVMHHIVNGGGGAYLSCPVDLSWQLNAAPGTLDLGQRFVYSEGQKFDHVRLFEIFPTSSDMLSKFHGPDETDSGLRRWVKRWEPWLVNHGYTNALDHDRTPLLQSFVTARMDQAYDEEGRLRWRLRLTPWFMQQRQTAAGPRDEPVAQPELPPIWAPLHQQTPLPEKQPIVSL